ncbi:hypothetical protein [Pseudarthrobacter albicanus]|uniref:hypothetical protein n=1 Tax=Pseudarthrobacter albicanus TaxID=2823873 RepID=UPI001BA584A8|nr:hypothetical protein [Pseudarthrobacter albicanus]
MSPVPARRVLVVEPNATGHRLYYVRLIVEEILARGQVALVATAPKADSSPEWNLHLSHLVSQTEYLASSDFTPMGIAILANRLDVDHVVVPDGDPVAIEIGRRRAWPAKASITVLVMREHAQPSRIPGVARLKGILKNGLLRSANTVQGVTVCILKSPLWAGYSSLPVALDPVTLAGDAAERLDASKAWNLDSTRYWFGIVGAITARKNLPLVAAAIARLQGENVGLVLAGKVSDDVRATIPEIQEMLAQSGTSFIVENRLLSELEIDSLIAALDCVVLAHSNEGSSGIMGKAAMSGTRIAAAGARSLKSDCRAVPLMSAWVPLTEADVSYMLARSSTLGRPIPIDGVSSRDFASALI